MTSSWKNRWRFSPYHAEVRADMSNNIPHKQWVTYAHPNLSSSLFIEGIPEHLLWAMLVKRVWCYNGFHYRNTIFCDCCYRVKCLLMTPHTLPTVRRYTCRSLFVSRIFFFHCCDMWTYREFVGSNESKQRWRWSVHENKIWCMCYQKFHLTRILTRRFICAHDDVTSTFSSFEIYSIQQTQKRTHISFILQD